MGQGATKEGLAETYRRTIFANVSAAFTAAIDDERLSKNPCNATSVTKPRGEYPKVVPWLEERVHGVRAALGERYQVMINLGLRQGEVFGISADDVDEESGILRVERQVKIVRNQMIFGLPKHRKTREVPLPASVLDAIKQHKRSFPLLRVTFPWETPDGKPVTVGLLIYTREHHQIHRHSFNHHVWKPALRASGVVNPGRADGFHALRHFYAGSERTRKFPINEDGGRSYLSTAVLHVARCYFKITACGRPGGPLDQWNPCSGARAGQTS